MAQARRGQGTVTETLQLCNASTSEPAQAQTINLRLAPRLKKKVTWQADTVDNEHMQKKKSKKCCIFEKAGGSDEDEDEDEDEDDHDGGKGKGKEHHHHRDCNHEDHDDPNHGATSSGSQSLD